MQRGLGSVPLSWRSAAGKQLFVSLSCSWHTRLSCIGSVPSQKVQAQQGLLSIQLTVLCRHLGKRHTPEQKVLGSAVLPHRTDPAAKQTSPPTNTPQPQGCSLPSCKELHLPGLGVKRCRNGPRAQPRSRFQVPFPTRGIREIKYPMWASP